MIPRSRSSKSPSTLAGLILVLSIVPLAAQRPAPAQRGGAPKPETPQLVVTVLASSDPTVGIAARDEIRRRIQSEHTATDIYVTPAATISDALLRSGYNPDSVLGQTDLMALTHQVRGDYALEGTVERTTEGVRTSIRLLTQTGPQIVAEPLVAIVGSDLGDIAKKVDRAVSDALRALAFNHECRRAALIGDYKQAMVAAQQGLKLMPTSALLNLCALSVLAATHAPTDSIIAVASAITAVDSTNVLAWASLADAYLLKSDSARALDATRRLHDLDPANVTLTLGLVDQLVGAGRPEAALGVIDTALSASPAHADLLRKKWLLDLRLGRFAEALKTGVVLVAADSAAGNADFYERQLAAAVAAHDSVSSHRIALEAAGRFPKNVDFLLVLARDAMDRGAPRDALGFADRVLAIEAGNTAAWQLAIAAHAGANGADSAVVVARRALAAGVARDAVAGSLLAVVAPPLARARDSHARSDWEAVLSAAQAVDSVAPSARSAFYVGFAAFQIVNDQIQSLGGKRPRTAAERQSSCSSATQLEDLVRAVTITMPRGGSVDPATATQILGALPGYSEFLTSVKQVSCRRD
jgi:tetratricopeptide (TPR) repeat protein